MRIGIDARFYGLLGKGLGRYTSELISALETVDSDNEYVVFLRKENFNDYSPKNPRFSKVMAEFPWYGWREQLLYPFFLKRFRLDLMHFCHFNVPLLYRRPFVVTVHDLILTKFPTPRASTLSPVLYAAKNALYRLVIGSAVRRAKAVLAMSLFTKKDIIETFPGAAGKPVVVTYQACGSAFRDTAAQGWDAAPTGQSVAGPYMLYVGNAYPHKNLDALIQAFAGFRAQRPEWTLVLVGAEDYFYSRLKREAEEKGIAAGVTFYGKAGDRELLSLYDNAAFYVFPSKYEGFGLPPLEAMCRGIAVASSNASCLPEILGDAARYFSPERPEAIAAAMEELATDGELRKALAAKGKIQSAKYDWLTLARQTKQVYEIAIGAKKNG